MSRALCKEEEAVTDLLAVISSGVSEDIYRHSPQTIASQLLQAPQTAGDSVPGLGSVRSFKNTTLSQATSEPVVDRSRWRPCHVVG